MGIKLDKITRVVKIEKVEKLDITNLQIFFQVVPLQQI